MIFITGDLHGDIDIKKLTSKHFNASGLTKNDYVIITGDFGFVWDNSKFDQNWLKWLDKRPFTTLFVDGNHENHNLLDAMPVQEWNGGKVHKINDSVYHLMRGQIFTLEGKKFFTFGGADSIDKESRKVDISWWAREMPSTAEYEEGLSNLEKHNNSIDYIITHTAPARVLKGKTQKDITVIEKYFDEIEQRILFKHWYFGHYHMDMRLEEKFTVLYNQIIRLI